MSRTILINARDRGETRIAFVDQADNSLSEYDVETSDHEKYRGNVYLGTVMNIEPSLQAAFIDFGGGRHGFLPYAEVSPQAYREEHAKNPRAIGDVLRKKQLIVVQVSRESVGNKGAALTTYLSIPGRYLVLMRGNDNAGISRKIEDAEERQRIKQLTTDLEIPEGFGVIVRTAGLNASKGSLQQDLKYITKTFQQLDKKAAAATGPALLHSEPDLVARTLRDYVTTEVEAIWVDDEARLEELREYVRLVMPRASKLLQLHDAPQPLFSKFGVEPQIEALYRPKVNLKSGGSVVIQQTEALVAIDVNTGKAGKSQNHENAAFQTNMEAAQTIARQLRLRDLGGIVVIDFIDMEVAEHKKEVEACLREALKSDKARTKIGHISALGTLEMTRQRVRPALATGGMVECELCAGTGRLMAPASQLARALRSIADKVSTYNPPRPSQFEVKAPARLALSLLNERRLELADLEQRFATKLLVTLTDGALSIAPRDNAAKEPSREVAPPREVASQRDSRQTREASPTPEVTADVAPLADDSKDTPTDRAAGKDSASERPARSRPRRRGRRNSGRNRAGAADATSREQPQSASRHDNDLDRVERAPADEPAE